jgi:hypothetical protein
MCNYELWQLEKYGDVVPESSNLFESEETKNAYEKQMDLLPENIISSYEQ